MKCKTLYWIQVAQNRDQWRNFGNKLTGCEISGSHGGDYEDDSLLGYSILMLGVSTHIWNVGLLQRDYTTLHPRRLPSPSSCDESVAVRQGTHSAFLYVELVEHRVPVEPVVHHEVSDVELPGSKAQETSLQPFRDTACGANTGS
jgi:hypothetical protein